MRQALSILTSLILLASQLSAQGNQRQMLLATTSASVGSATFVQKSLSSTGTTSVAVTLGSSVTAGNMLIVIVVGNSGTCVFSISDNNSNTYSATTTYNNGRLVAYYVKNPVLTNNPPTITVTNSQANAYQFSVREYSGLSGVADGSAGTTTPTAINPQLTDTLTTTAKDILVAGFWDAAAASNSGGSGWTNVDATVGAYNHVFEDRLNLAAGSYQGADIPASSSSNWNGFVAAFKVQ